MFNNQPEMTASYKGLMGCDLLPYGPGYIVNHQPSWTC
jgi:hypothetical protein